MADTIKKFRITGEAAKSLMSETKTRKRVKLQKGGEAPIQVTRSDAPSFTPLPAPAVVKPYVAPAAPAPAPAPAPITQDQHGGRKDVKVILDKSNNKTRKLILAPKKVIKLPSGPNGLVNIPKKHPAKTQKVARRIRVSVAGLNKRVNRAKTIKKESQVMPIEKLKKELETAGLIKAGSKAPEMILRQMYTDFQVLKQRAL